ncbi:VWA domain-containing protein [Blastopirellula sp. JC732]|uniref:VWA domain-containing protein n=1 Tax=Blastopirellula sediminis TaxID=2894196 RepID=A0A9X1SG63_9BACT|nr:vWA domain-containing protein [Blastopirellula sediminis]MCC9608877.1 VWA domain-containing protein [Blastopirellula sediminis]MCC9628346.1 VWA domain-containing protein [Blastopirellula sediminis]
MASLIFHLALVILLALLTFDSAQDKGVREIILDEAAEEPLERLLEEDLHELTELATEMTVASMPEAVAGLAGMAPASLSAPQLQTELLDGPDAPEVAYVDIQLLTQPTETLMRELPVGTQGASNAVVSDYSEAMDRIAQELVWMLDKGEVVVLWVFDQSESMKDDQAKIRERIGRVYDELGIVGASKEEALTTAIASYGASFELHTPTPTSDRKEIDAAIASIPIDASGKEMTLPAIMEVIGRHKRYAQTAKRKMAVILVSDESGDPDGNQQYLEETIEAANIAKCSVYILGREAMFGYPYSHVRWENPRTGEVHWLPINRGPETGLIEQLQTDGFGKRYDSLTSGYGPYEQVRLAKETGGIFFMLPGEEKNLVALKDFKYDVEAMEPYRPDLRQRSDLMREATKDRLQTIMTKVIYDLNPYNKEVADIVQIRHRYSIEFPKLVEQVKVELGEMGPYVKYLDRAIAEVEKAKPLRDASPSYRQQANYDLLLAQLIAYRARAYEYGAYATEFMKKAPEQPKIPSSKHEFRAWERHTTKRLLAEEQTAEDVARSSKLLKEIMQEYAGTPWAERAKWELNRGFGCTFSPWIFDGTRFPDAKNAPPIKVPKL